MDGSPFGPSFSFETARRRALKIEGSGSGEVTKTISFYMFSGIPWICCGARVGAHFGAQKKPTEGPKKDGKLKRRRVRGVPEKVPFLEYFGSCFMLKMGSKMEPRRHQTNDQKLAARACVGRGCSTRAQAYRNPQCLSSFACSQLKVDHGTWCKRILQRSRNQYYDRYADGERVGR